jgi:co-chaperonin GroES (HSP10)
MAKKGTIVNVEGKTYDLLEEKDKPSPPKIELPKGKLNLKEGFEEVEPLGDYILVEVTTKETMGMSKGGILVVKDAMDQAMPCLQIVKVSVELNNTKGLKPGDVIEIADISRLTYHHGINMEQFALVDNKYIAGVYRKKE